MFTCRPRSPTRGPEPSRSSLSTTARSFEAFFFDLDGTLLYTLGDIAANANYALSQRGCPTHETERYRQFVGDGVLVLMKRILPEGRRTPEEIEALREIYMARDAERACALTRPYDLSVPIIRIMGDSMSSAKG